MPLPETVSKDEQSSENKFDLEKILKKDSKEIKKDTVKSNNTFQKSVIEKIQNN